MQVRNTNQRKLILDLMTDNYSHPTADEIYEAARKLDPHISRGTVYRNLNFLAESGSILKISVPDGADHFDSTLKPHYHFHCEKCGRMYDVPQSIKLEMSNAIQEMQENGFSVQDHNLIFTGLCPDCRK
ncbi:MAG: transcriptional repressor [Treponemataceae bacterium]|nr:transcriptional repressor [Treponemataceae bacterium]